MDLKRLFQSIVNQLSMDDLFQTWIKILLSISIIPYLKHALWSRRDWDKKCKGWMGK